MTAKVEIDAVQMEKLRMDLLDSLDEEIETELEDRDDVAALLMRQAHRSERLTYFRELLRLQSELVKLQDWVVAHKHRVVVLFEGRDAAGKGGVIKRITQRLNPRICRVAPVAKPTEEEKHAHYLWRFWREVPRDGRVTVFDRSWYGRVLVERVEGFCRAEEWRRAYGEINDFERQLTDHGTVVIKYWLHVSHEEQLRRFQERESTPHKQHKLNDEDWRNRRKRPAYEAAVGDMLALTDTPHAPWQLVPADDKRFARIEVLRTATRLLEAALE